jgi:hypothetical protein
METENLNLRSLCRKQQIALAVLRSMCNSQTGHLVLENWEPTLDDLDRRVDAALAETPTPGHDFPKKTGFLRKAKNAVFDFLCGITLQDDGDLYRATTPPR